MVWGHSGGEIPNTHGCCGSSTTTEMSMRIERFAHGGGDTAVPTDGDGIEEVTRGSLSPENGRGDPTVVPDTQEVAIRR